MWVGSFQEKVDLFDGAGVQSTPSMQNILKLGGLGACPQENLKNRYQNTGLKFKYATVIADHSYDDQLRSLRPLR